MAATESRAALAVPHHSFGIGERCTRIAARQLVDHRQFEAPAGPDPCGKQAARQRRDDRDGDQERKHDRYRNRDRDVAEKLADLEVHRQDRHEHQNRGQRRDQDRAPDLARAPQRGFARRHAALAQSVDVLQHDDGRIDDHAHGEGDAGERHDIERTPEHGHGNEGAHDGDGNRQRDDQRRPPGPQKQQQHDRGKRAADDDVLPHEPDGGQDVIGFVIDLLHDEALGRQQGYVKFGDGGAHAFHGLDDIGPGLALGVHHDGVGAEPADARARLRIAVGHFGNVADRHAPDPPGGAVRLRAQHDRAHRFRRVQFALSADEVAPFAFFDIACGDRGVRRPELLRDLGDGQAELRHPLRQHDDMQLALDPAEEIGPGDALHALQPVLDHLLDKIAIGVTGRELSFAVWIANQAMELSSAPAVRNVGRSASSG